MRQQRHAIGLALTLLAFLLLPANAAAQGSGFSLGLLGGFGGSPDSDSYTGGSFELLAAMERGTHSLTEVRIGLLDLEASPEVPNSELTYVTLGTDYRLNADFYSSGLVLGVGYYHLESDSGFLDEDSLGLHLGVLGEFGISDRWSILGEFMGHYTDLDSAQFFLMAHAGVVFKF